MENYFCLLVLVSLSCYVCSVQFEDDASNLGQTKQSESAGFFPSSDEPDERYSDISGIKYVDPQNYYDDTSPDVSYQKQLNFNGNSHRQTLPGSNHYSQQRPYRPGQTINSPVNINVIRKRPMKLPYQYTNSPSNYYNSYPTDLSNPFYQNYANHYQYPAAAASSSYPDYYNPTRYPSPASANLNGQQPLLHQPSIQYPNYYTNNYANQFEYQRPSPIYGNSGVGGVGEPNGVSSFLNNIRQPHGPLGQISQVGGQFTKALEDISENDDLQCVPKVLCQMIKGSRRPNSLPSFLNVPGISAIISALPSSSPLMNFGRAALLGLSAGGECDAAYPKCPRNEEQMLYYLNNHRGGFFRFFNGGNSFGDDNILQQQQQQLSGQTFHQQQSTGDVGGSQGLNLLTLQALAEALNQGNGVNLNNLFSSPTNQRPVSQSYQGLQAEQSQGGLLSFFNPSSLSDMVSNLLTGVVGTRFSRRISKRSLPDEIIDEGHHQIEKRIVNLKEKYIQAEQQNFFEVSSNDQQQNTLYNLEEPFTFPNDNRINNSPQVESVLALKFPKENAQQEIRISEINQGNFISPSDIARQLKMLFPEAAGHLRFDNDQFNRELLKALVNDRIGKILTGVQQQQRPINNNYDINRYQGSLNYNNNQNTNQKYQTQSPNYAGVASSNYNNFNSNHINRGQQQQQSNGDRKHIVYITNSQGKIEYTLNELTGEKNRYYK